MISATIVGHLGADAVQTTTKDGKPMAKVRVGVCTKRWPEDKTVWVSLLLFGEKADEFAPQLKRGLKVVAAGKLDIEEWRDKDDNLRLDPVLFVDELSLGEKTEGSGPFPPKKERPAATGRTVIRPKPENNNNNRRPPAGPKQEEQFPW